MGVDAALFVGAPLVHAGGGVEMGGKRRRFLRPALIILKTEGGIILLARGGCLPSSSAGPPALRARIAACNKADGSRGSPSDCITIPPAKRANAVSALKQRPGRIVSMVKLAYPD